MTGALRKRLCSTIVSASICTHASAADPVVSLEVLHTSQNAARFGEYNDLHEGRSHVVGGVELQGLSSASSEQGIHWTIDARNLGLGTYDANFSLVAPSRFEADLSFKGLRQFSGGDGETPFRGTDSLLLPSDWVAGPATGDMTNLADSLRSFDQRKNRDITRFDALYAFGSDWTLQAGFRNEHKTGTQVQGGAVFVDASRGNAALLPAPIDYTTQDFSSTLRYATVGMGASLAYVFTHFDNDYSTLAWDNPYSGVVDPVADHPTGRGAMSLAPEYDRQQVRLDGYLMPFPGLSVQWDGAWSTTKQDDTFAPYTINPALIVTQALPRNSLNGVITTWTSDVRVSYRPRIDALRKLTLRGGYHYDDRDDDKPRDAYRYVRGDGADQPDAALAIFDTTHDLRREGFDAGADYRLPWWHSKLSAEYQYQDTQRRNAAVDRTQTDTYRIVLRATPVAAVGARAEWSFSDRAASTYHWEQSFFSRRTADFIDQTPVDQRFDNHPALHQYNLASARIETAKFDVSYSGIERWYFDANVEWREFDYDHSQFGLLKTQSWWYGLDIQFTPADAVTTFAFASFTRYDSDSAGRSFGGGIEKPANRTLPPLPQGSDPARDWGVSRNDQMWVAGTGATWRYSERLELEARYTVVTTKSGNRFTSSGSPFLDTTPLPDIETTLHDVSLSANYQLHDHASVAFRYQYYRFEQDDWAFDGVTPTTLASVLTLGETADNENVNVVGVSVSYAF